MCRGLMTPSALLIVSLLVACDSGGSGASRGSSSADRGTGVRSSRQATPPLGLGLARRQPPAYRGVCSMQAATAPAGARTCPPLIPAGPLKVAYRGKSLGRDGPDGGFSADLASRSLDR